MDVANVRPYEHTSLHARSAAVHRQSGAGHRGRRFAAQEDDHGSNRLRRGEATHRLLGPQQLAPRLVHGEALFRRDLPDLYFNQVGTGPSRTDRVAGYSRSRSTNGRYRAGVSAFTISGAYKEITSRSLAISVSKTNPRRPTVATLPTPREIVASATTVLTLDIRTTATP